MDFSGPLSANTKHTWTPSLYMWGQLTGYSGPSLTNSTCTIELQSQIWFWLMAHNGLLLANPHMQLISLYMCGISQWSPVASHQLTLYIQALTDQICRIGQWTTVDHYEGRSCYHIFKASPLPIHYASWPYIYKHVSSGRVAGPHTYSVLTVCNHRTDKSSAVLPVWLTLHVSTAPLSLLYYKGFSWPQLHIYKPCLVTSVQLADCDFLIFHLPANFTYMSLVLPGTCGVGQLGTIAAYHPTLHVQALSDHTYGAGWLLTAATCQPTPDIWDLFYCTCGVSWQPTITNCWPIPHAQVLLCHTWGVGQPFMAAAYQPILYNIQAMFDHTCGVNQPHIYKPCLAAHMGLASCSLLPLVPVLQASWTSSTYHWLKFG